MLPWEPPELALEKAATGLCNTQYSMHHPGVVRSFSPFSCQKLGEGFEGCSPGTMPTFQYTRMWPCDGNAEFVSLKK